MFINDKEIKNIQNKKNTKNNKLILEKKHFNNLKKRKKFTSEGLYIDSVIYGNGNDDIPDDWSMNKVTRQVINLNENNYDDYEEYLSDNRNIFQKLKYIINNTKHPGLIRTCLWGIFLAIIITTSILIYSSLKKEYLNFQFTEFGLVSGKSYQVNFINKSQKEIQFSTNNSDILSLNIFTGVIKGISDGTAIIDVKTGNKINKLTVHVTSKKVDLKDFTVQKKLRLKKGENYLIPITLSPKEASSLDFKYQSSDTNIVEVSNIGNILAKEKGEATITITNDKIEKQINVKVK